MKKSRPAVMLCCLCREEQRDTLLRCFFENTATLGVREQRLGRHTLNRRTETVDTSLGTVRVKYAEGFGVRRHKIEYEDLAAVSRREGISIREARSIVEEEIR